MKGIMKMSMTNKHSKRRRTTNEATSGISNLIKSCGIGLLFGIGSAFILSLIASIICIGRKDPASLTPYFSLVILGISAFIGGAVSSKLCKTSSILSALITGGAEMVIFYLLSYILPSIETASKGFIISTVIRGIVLILSALGGSLGERKISHKTRKKRR
jgi:putative membrane protein (TIGR04086 family)